MKKKFIIAVSVILLIAFASLVFGACTEEQKKKAGEVATQIKSYIETHSSTVTVGASFYPWSATELNDTSKFSTAPNTTRSAVYFSSSDPEEVSVASNGTITALKVTDGTAIITANVTETTTVTPEGGGEPTITQKTIAMASWWVTVKEA